MHTQGLYLRPLKKHFLHRKCSLAAFVLTIMYSSLCHLYCIHTTQSHVPQTLHHQCFRQPCTLLHDQAYEEQLGQARAIQAQLQLCEEELEARTQDLTRYAADNRNLQLHSAELGAELDSVRDEANSRISQLEAANQDQGRLAQHHNSELTSSRKRITELEAKLHSRSGVLADHSERAKQLQQVSPCSCMLQLSCHCHVTQMLSAQNPL